MAGTGCSDGWDNITTRDARLPHSCEPFDIGGAFAAFSFGS